MQRRKEGLFLHTKKIAFQSENLGFLDFLKCKNTWNHENK